MNCEQVEERLSAYLDNMLVSEESREVAIHLRSCPHCTRLLAELSQYDMLLARLPRVSPSLALRERLFALAEVRELGETPGHSPHTFSANAQTQPLMPYSRPTLDMRDPRNQPRLLALPGDRDPQWQLPLRDMEIPPTPPTVELRPASRSYPAQRYHPSAARKRWFSPLKVALLAVLLITLGAASLLGLSLRHQPDNVSLSGAITPPAGPFTGQSLPLAAGSRFVFLRAGTLWSTLVDGGQHQPERLTPVNVTVAAGWVVNPPQGNQDAGDLLAYIDSQGGHIHTIRSDSQQDTAVPLALLQSSQATVWQETSGQIILKSLAWSPDSSSLAFVADPAGSGQTGLYLFTPVTGAVRQLAGDLKGSIAHPIWSPDGTRLAFTLAHDNVVSVLDYNVQSRSVLDLSNLPAAQGSGLAGVLALNWFSSGGQVAVTWSLGSIGHISSIWVHRVGTDGTIYPQLLTSGTYLQALYSPGSNNQTGGWLLVSSVVGQAGDLWRLNLTAGGQLLRLSQGKEVGFALWSPDGSGAFYLDRMTNGLGNGHLLNVITGADQLLPDQAMASPAPDWSTDGLQLAYSTDTRIDIVSSHNSAQVTRLHLSGSITNLSWSPATAHQLIASLDGQNSGLYLVDVQRNSARLLDGVGITSALQWTQIP
ncbi:MAG TPA: zf-HC2 domain-containing protein [Ktedonobacteraceae bacterium]